jgi:16S rRNA (guanine(966)-N(2))-methyltransferase RsmD
MLKIQSGTARGRLMRHTPKGYEVRPILARIRKSLFDILRPRLADALFLDLFAGAGTVGLEAISNGARRAVFVDSSTDSCRMIEHNAADLGFADRVEVRQGDAIRDMLWLAGEKFDIVFLGPPYKDEGKKPLALTVPTLARLAESDVLADGGVVIGQHHEKEPLAGLDPRWEIFRTNEYGDSTLTFFRKAEGTNS